MQYFIDEIYTSLIKQTLFPLTKEKSEERDYVIVDGMYYDMHLAIEMIDKHSNNGII